MEGSHLKLLGRGAPARLGNVLIVRPFLEDLVRAIGMRALEPPRLFNVETSIRKLGAEPFEDEGGVTGIVVLSTSHVAIHTWPLRVAEPRREMFVLDVFSCREFGPSQVQGLVRDRFDAYNVVCHDLSGTLSYPGH